MDPDQDWETLLKEQEEFLLASKKDDTEKAARVMRGHGPKISTRTSGGGGIYSLDALEGDGHGESVGPRVISASSVGDPSTGLHPSRAASKFSQSRRRQKEEQGAQSQEESSSRVAKPDATAEPAVSADHLSTSGSSAPAPAPPAKEAPFTGFRASGAVFLTNEITDKAASPASPSKGLKPMTMKPMRIAVGPPSKGMAGFPPAPHRSLGGPSLGRRRERNLQEGVGRDEAAAAPPTPQQVNRNPPMMPAASTSSSTSSSLPGSDRGAGGGGGGMGSMLDEISAENEGVVAGMSPEAVAEALAELREMFSDQSLSLLKERGLNRRRNDGGGDAAQRAGRRGSMDLTGDGDVSNSGFTQDQPLGVPSPEHDSELAPAPPPALPPPHDDASLAAALTHMPLEERIKHAWMTPSPTSAKATAATMGTTPGSKRAGTAGSSSPSSSSSTFTGTILDDDDKGSGDEGGGAGGLEESSDENGQRFDLNGWPLIANTPQHCRHRKDDPKHDPKYDDEDEVGVHLGLHHHGRQHQEAGYTLDECCVLMRSLSAPQRALSTRIVSRALANARVIMSVESSEHAGAVARSLTGATATAGALQPQTRAAAGRADTSSASGLLSESRRRLSDSLRPLRLPVQVPALCVELLGDSSLAVRSEAAHLACALADDDHHSPTHEKAPPPPPHKQVQELANYADGNGYDCDGEGLVDDPGFEAWQAHLALPPLPLSPFRRLVVGQTSSSSSVAARLRRVSWEDPSRRDEEELDDVAEEQAKLLALAQKVLDEASGNRDEEDQGDDDGGDEDEDEEGKRSRRVWDKAGAASGGGGVLSSPAALRLTACRLPLRPFINLNPSDDGGGIGKGDGSGDASGNESTSSSSSSSSVQKYRMSGKGGCLISRLAGLLLDYCSNDHGGDDGDDGHSSSSSQTTTATTTLPSPSVEAAFSTLCALSRQSKEAAEAVARHPGLLQGLRRSFLEPHSNSPSSSSFGAPPLPSTTATTTAAPAPAAAKEATAAANSGKGANSGSGGQSTSQRTWWWWWHAAPCVKLLRTLCGMSREVALHLAQDGTLLSLKGFLALQPPALPPAAPSLEAAGRQRLRACVLEVLRLWRTCLAYGVDLESLVIVLPINLPHPAASPAFQNTSSSQSQPPPPPSPTSSSSSSTSFFATRAWVAEVASRIPLAARLATVFDDNHSAKQPPPPSTAERFGALEDDDDGPLPAASETTTTTTTTTNTSASLGDPLVAALFLCLEQAAWAWHHLSPTTSANGGNGGQDDENGGDDDGGVLSAAVEDQAAEGQGQEASAQAEAGSSWAIRNSGVVVDADTLEACGAALLGAGEAVRKAIVASTPSDGGGVGAGEGSGSRAGESAARAFVRGRSGAAMAAFVAAMSEVGKARTKAVKALLAETRSRLQQQQRALTDGVATLRPLQPKSQAFFVPPPPEPGVPGVVQAQMEVQLQLQLEQRSAVEALLVASSEDLENFADQEQGLATASGDGGDEGDSSSDSSSSDSSTAALTELRRLSVASKLRLRHLESRAVRLQRVANAFTCLARMAAHLIHRGVPSPSALSGGNGSGASSGISSSSSSRARPHLLLGLEVSVLLARRLDRFIRHALLVEPPPPSSATPSSSSSSSDHHRHRAGDDGHTRTHSPPPLTYRLGHAGGSTVLGVRTRASVRRLLLAASALFLEQQQPASVAPPSLAQPSAPSAHDESGDDGDGGRAEEVRACAVEWVALSVSLFESGQEGDAAGAIQRYLTLRRQQQQPSGSRGGEGGAASTNTPSQLLLGRAFRDALAPLFADAVHGRALSDHSNGGDRPRALSLLPPLEGGAVSPLTRHSLALLPSGQRRQVPLHQVVAATLHSQEQRKQAATAKALQHDAGMSASEAATAAAAASSSSSSAALPLNPATAVLPLPTHWLALPFLSKPPPPPPLQVGAPSGGGSDGDNVTTSSLGTLQYAVIELLHGLCSRSSSLSSSRTVEQLSLTNNHFESSVHPGHALFLLFDLLVFSPTESDSGDNHHHHRRACFVRELFSAFYSRVCGASLPEGNSSSSSGQSRFGYLLSSAAYDLCPPTPLDRVEDAIARSRDALQLRKNKNKNEQKRNVSVALKQDEGVDLCGSCLANVCLAQMAKLLAHRFIANPPPPPPQTLPLPPPQAAADELSTSTFGNGNGGGGDTAAMVRHALRCVFLRRDVASAVRVCVWREVAQAQLLHLLAEGWAADTMVATTMTAKGGREGAELTGGGGDGEDGGNDDDAVRAYLCPFEDDPSVLSAYINGVASMHGRPVLTQEAATTATPSFLWVLAATHLTAYIASSSATAWGRRQRLAELLDEVPVENVADLFLLGEASCRRLLPVQPPTHTRTQPQGGEEEEATARDDDGDAGVPQAPPFPLPSLEVLGEVLIAVATERPDLKQKIDELHALFFLKRRV